MMSRIPFSQVLKNASIDLRREYDRLYSLFYLQTFQINQTSSTNLRDYCATHFVSFPFRGTCVSLDDFDEFYGHHYEKTPKDIDQDYLVSFCEYIYNILYYSRGIGYNGLGFIQAFDLSEPIQFCLQQVLQVIEAIGYMPNVQDGITDFAPKNQASISVAEIVDSDLSYKVIEYNHHSMKGDLERKKSILLTLADKLEPQRGKLKQINSSLESDLFYLLNTVNIRHNNSEPEGTKYKKVVAKMSKDSIEKWYDDIYQMCLLAFMELDNAERKGRVKELKKRISEQ